MKNDKNKIILILMFTLCIMAFGYSYLSVRIQIIGNINLSSRWKIQIPEENGIECKSINNNENVEIASSVTGTNVNFNIKFNRPGDKVVCKVNIKNKGSLPARASKVIVFNEEKLTTGPIVVSYSGINGDTEGLKDGTKLAVSSTNTMDINIEYVDAIITEENKEQNIDIQIEYIQDL